MEKQKRVNSNTTCRSFLDIFMLFEFLFSIPKVENTEEKKKKLRAGILNDEGLALDCGILFFFF